MSGRLKKRVYIYSLEGVFIEWFESQSDFRDKYFPKDAWSRPILRNQEKLTTLRLRDEVIKYTILKDVIVFERRIYRDDVKYLVTIHNSEFCKQSDKNQRNKEIEVLNLKREVIATFKNLRLLNKMMPHIPESTISYGLNQAGKKSKKKKIVDGGLFFRYKNDNIDSLLGKLIKKSDSIDITEKLKLSEIKKGYPDIEFHPSPHDNWYHIKRSDGKIGRVELPLTLSTDKLSEE